MAAVSISRDELIERLRARKSEIQAASTAEAETNPIAADVEAMARYATCRFYAPSETMAAQHKLSPGPDYEYDGLFHYSPCFNPAIDASHCIREGDNMMRCTGYTPEPIRVLRDIVHVKIDAPSGDTPPSEVATRYLLDTSRIGWGVQEYRVSRMTLINIETEEWSVPVLLHRVATTTTEEDPSIHADALFADEIEKLEGGRFEERPLPVGEKNPLLATLVASRG